MRITHLGSGRAMEKRWAYALVVLAVVWLCGSASAQSSSGTSINIDCGATADTTDAVGVQWVTDASYILTGTNHQGFNPPTDSTFASLSELTTLRFFADTRAKNCYRFPVVKNVTYLLRAAFFYGNYDNAATPPSFQLSLEATVVENVTTSSTEVQYKEILYLSQSNVTDLCFLRYGANGGTPFVSSISLRQVTEVYERFNMYLGNHKYMTIRTRINFGGSDLVRYPDDRYDRYWHPEGSSSPYLSLTTTPVQALRTDTSITSEAFRPPSAVLQSAVTTNSSLRSYYLKPGTPSSVFYQISFILLHFAELDPAATSTSRVFYMDVGTGNIPTKMNPYNESGGLFQRTTWLFWDREIGATTNLTLLPDSLTVQGPILNGMEMYSVSDSRPTTGEDDVTAIEAIKTDMNLSEWTGDPCVPSPHPWVQCRPSSTVLNAPEVTAINLTGYNLTGPISPSFANLVSLTSLSLGNNALTGLLPDLSPLKLLTTLNLENNNLSGPLPEWLTTLQLTVLTVQNNNFNGTIPAGLISSNLKFTSCPGNSFVGRDCKEASTTSKSKKSSNLPAIIGATVGGVVLALLIIIVGIYIGFRCRRRNANPQQPSGGRAVPLQEIIGSSSGPSKAFSLATLATATNNFQNEIGRGGFGPVYHGILPDGREVAVKVADNQNRPGDQEFHNEVSLLSTLHHRNLTMLVGYCQEKKKQILVYEYVRDGSLHDQLHGKLKSSRPLDWRTRLNIALNAARGLDYLHSNCQPSIIHRDVKSGNILLTGPGYTEVAKVSDFGFSRAGPVQDNTHVSTEIRGTAGYLDPQYFNTQKLTLKSDVFSFGVVLLELITGRLPIDSSVANRDDWNLCQYVRNVLGGSVDVDIEQILDPVVRACRPNLDAVWVVAEVALRSVEPKAVHRPTMADVLQELQIAVALELRASQAPPAIKQQQQHHPPHSQSHERFISQPDSMIFYEPDTMPEPR